MSYSPVTYTGDGMTTTFSVPFPYLSQEEVIVTVDDASVSHTFLSDSLIEISPAPASGEKVFIERNTDDTERDVVWSNVVALTANQLNTSVNQLFYMAQEAKAVASRAIYKDYSGQFSADSLRIKDLAEPVDDSDAATKNYVDQVLPALEQTVEDAVNEAETYSQSAAASASAASTTASEIEDLIDELPFEVPTYDDLAGVTSSDRTTGQFVRTTIDGSVLEVAPSSASDEHLDFTGSGGLPFYVRPKDGVFNILHFGAQPYGSASFPKDNAAAIQLAMEEASNTGGGGGTVIIPPGHFWTETLINPTIGDDACLTIRGSGNRASAICLDGNSTHGGLKLNRPNRYTSFVMDGVSILCNRSQLETVGRDYMLYVTSDIGITAGQPDSGYGYSNKRSFEGHNLILGSYDVAIGTRGSAEAGAIIEYGRWPLLSNVHMDVRSLSNLDTYPNTYHTGDGVGFIDCYYGEIINSRVSGRWENGVHFQGNQDSTGSHADFEGGIVRNCKVLGFPRYGVSIEHLGRDESAQSLKEPGFFVQDNHIHAHESGVHMVSHCVSEITGNNIATTNSSQTHVTNENHIYLEDVYSVNITGNQFWGWGYYNNENDCTRGVVLGPLCHHVSLDCNHHMHKGIGILNEDATNFDIVIGDSCVWQSRTSGGDKFAVSGPTVKIKNDVGGDLRIGGWKKTEFLPELSFGNQSDGITYSERSGVMYRRGNEVYGHLYINLSSKGTATGSVGIGADVGLPPAETEFSGNITVNYLANATFTDETIPIGFLSGDKIRLRDATTNLTSVATDAEFGNITTLRLTFRYFAEQD